MKRVLVFLIFAVCAVSIEAGVVPSDRVITLPPIHWTNEDPYVDLGRQSESVQFTSLPHGWQSIRFDIHFTNYFKHSKYGHVAVALNSSAQDIDTLDGAGLLMGYASLRPDGCSISPAMQVETFDRTNVTLYLDTCSPIIEDGVTYSIEMSHHEFGVVYNVYHGGKLFHSDIGGVSQYAGNNLLLVHVFSNPDQPWEVDISNITVSISARRVVPIYPIPRPRP